MSEIQEILQNHKGVPCWKCKHFMEIQSEVFESSFECSMDVQDIENIQEEEHDRSGQTITQHAKAICPSFSKGKRAIINYR